MSKFSTLTLQELKTIAKENNIYGYSNKKKAQLIKLILNNSNIVSLKKIAKKLKIKYYYKMNRDELIKKIEGEKQYIVRKKIKKTKIKGSIYNESVKTLKEVAKEMKIKKYYKMSKDELINKINNERVKNKIKEGIKSLKEMEKTKKHKNKIKEGLKIIKEMEKRKFIENIDFDDESDNYERFEKTKKSFKDVISTYKDTKLDSDLITGLDYAKYFDELKEPLINHIENVMEDIKSAKINFYVKFLMIVDDDVDKSFHRYSKPISIYEGEDISDDVITKIDEIKDIIEDLTAGKSDIYFKRIEEFKISYALYKPLTGGIKTELPEGLRDANGKNRSLCNIDNNDNLCFVYSNIADTVLKETTSRVDRYRKYLNEVNTKGIDFPVGKKDYEKFEKQNNKKINVFIHFKKIGLRQYYLNKDDPKNAINLLLVGDINKGEEGHYVLIKNFDGLNNGISKHKEKKHFCIKCLQYFTRKDILDKHLEDCKLTTPGEIFIYKLPNGENKILKFKNYKNKIRIPYAIYGDFECINKKKNDENESQTKKITDHIPSGFGYKVVSRDPNYESKYYTFTGEGAHENFMQSIMKTEEEILEKLNNIEKIKMTEEEEESYKNATHCHICKNELGKITKLVKNKYVTNVDKVRDHCHITGEYRGPAHNSCNLNYKEKPFIPVFFHNLKGYDAHLILQVAAKYTKKITCIAQNSEKYISFSINKLRFLDSLQFLNSSLSELVKNLKPEQFKIMRDNFDEKTVNLLLKKGVYPYEYMDSFDKFNETKLPEINNFYSKLTGSTVSEEEYKHAQNVWNELKIKNMREWHDLYLKTDVLLLADVFEAFRDLSMKIYNLDPCHYYTVPGLAWDAMLYMTQVNLELMTDIDMLNFIEKGMRGGISYINHRYAKANNKYMNEYNEKEDSSYIIYLDANNLYGCAMSQLLPVGNFRWVDEECIKQKFDTKENIIKRIMGLSDEAEKGYIFEVDLEYPNEIHDLHNDYPMAVSRELVNYDKLSTYQKNVASRNTKGEIIQSKVEKLIPSLANKTKYVIHYRNLKYYMSKGLIVTKVHRILTFKQTDFLKKYIDFNSNMRAGKIINEDGTITTKKVSDFEKDFYKLMNNSVYGKTLENVKNRIDADLCIGREKAIKKIRSLYYKCSKIFNKNLCFIEKYKNKVELFKPTYVGFSVLELSKLLMYQFHYDYIMKKYGPENAKLLFTDTDSLTYHVKTDDIYKDMAENSDLFDFSDYPSNILKDSKGNITKEIEDKDKNKKIIGKFKDETNSKPIIEFVGLRSKMYALKTENEEKKTAKGISRTVKKKYIKFADYKKCIDNPENIQRITQHSIKTENHKLYTIEQNKKSLSAFDDKKYINEDGISTLSYGHHELKSK